MSKNQKRVIVIICVVLILLIINIYTNIKDNQRAEYYKNIAESTSTTETDATDKTEPEPEEITEEEHEKKISEIYNKTYEYSDEFLDGKPQTFTFGSTGGLLITYWQELENETIKIGEDRCKYIISDDLKEITIQFMNGTQRTKKFEIKRNSIMVGNAEYKISKKQIYDEN